MSRIILTITSLLMVGLSVACPNTVQSSGGDTTAIQTGAVRDAVVVVPPAPSPAPYGGESSYQRSVDGFYVAAWFWAPAAEPAPGVILLHMRGADKSSWGDMPEKLLAEGFAVVAIDLRGHGETLDPAGRTARLEALSDTDYMMMLNDVAAAHSLLAAKPQVDADRIAVVGASIGANLAIMYAADEGSVRTAVTLSPGVDFFNLRPLEYINAYGERALYLIAAEGDEPSYSCCQQIEEASQADPVSMRVFPGKDHGTNLLAAHPGLDMTIISGWLLNHLPPR